MFLISAWRFVSVNTIRRRSRCCGIIRTHSSTMKTRLLQASTCILAFCGHESSLLFSHRPKTTALNNWGCYAMTRAVLTFCRHQSLCLLSQHSLTRPFATIGGVFAMTRAGIVQERVAGHETARQAIGDGRRAPRFSIRGIRHGRGHLFSLRFFRPGACSSSSFVLFLLTSQTVSCQSREQEGIDKRVYGRKGR